MRHGDAAFPTVECLTLIRSVSEEIGDIIYNLIWLSAVLRCVRGCKWFADLSV